MQILILAAGMGKRLADLTNDTTKYTASITMVPQVSDGSSKMGGLSSLAAMAGFNVDMSKGNSELSPMLYPHIISTVPFQLEIMNTPFVFPNQSKPISLYHYYTKI